MALAVPDMSKFFRAWCGNWCDGLLTTAGQIKDTQKKIALFRANAGEKKPVYLQFAFSYSRNSEQPIKEGYDPWRFNILPVEQLADISAVEVFDKAAEAVTLDAWQKSIPVFTDMDELREKMNGYLVLGIERLILHNVNRQQAMFIEDFKRSKN